MAFKRGLGEGGRCYCTADKKHCLDAFFLSLNPSAPTSCVTLGQLSGLLYASVPSSNRNWQKLVARAHICHKTSVLMAGQRLALSVACEKHQGAQCLLWLWLGFILLDATLGSSSFRVTLLEHSYLHNFRIKEKLQKNTMLQGDIVVVDFDTVFQVSQAGLELIKWLRET